MVEKKVVQFKERGDIEYKNQKYKDAIGRYQEALELDSTYNGAWYCLGRALEKIQQEFTADALFCFKRAGNYKDAKTYVEKLNKEGESKTLQLHITKKCQENSVFWILMGKCENKIKRLATSIVIIIIFIIFYLAIYLIRIDQSRYPWEIPTIMSPILYAMVLRVRFRFRRSIEKYIQFQLIRFYFSFFFTLYALIFTIIEGFYSSESILYVILVNWSFYLYYFEVMYSPQQFNNLGRFMQKIRLFNYYFMEGNLGKTLNLSRDIKWIFRKEGIQIENFKELEKELNKRILSDSMKFETQKKNELGHTDHNLIAENGDTNKGTLSKKQSSEEKIDLSNFYPQILGNLNNKEGTFTFSSLLNAMDIPKVIISKQSKVSSLYSFAENLGKVISVITPSVLLTIVTLILTGNPG